MAGLAVTKHENQILLHFIGLGETVVKKSSKVPGDFENIIS
jgi:hypothetical protein